MGASWVSLGGLLGLLEVDLLLNVFFAALAVWKGRLGVVLGSILRFLEAVFDFFISAFKLPSSQQIEHAKSSIY